MNSHAAWDDRLAAALISEQAASLGARQASLLPLLQALQARFGYIDARAVAPIAKALNISQAEIHGVVSFYKDFRAAPLGRHHLQLCQAEACQSVGARELGRHACARLNLRLGETSADGAVSLDAVYCLGHCAAAPAALVDGQPVARLDRARLDAILDRIAP